MTRPTGRVPAVAALVITLMTGTSGAVGQGLETWPAKGFTPRTNASVAWTGDELFVFGGQRSRARGPAEWLLDDGALFDLETGREREVANAPFERPLVVPTAATSKGDVFVFGGACTRPTDDGDGGYYCAGGERPTGARYDVADDEWHEIEVPREVRQQDADLSIRALGATKGGTVVLEMADHSESPPAPADYRWWSYEARTEDWTELPPPPVEPLRSRGAACLLGDQLAVLSVRYDHQGVVTDIDPEPWSLGGQDGYIDARLARYDLDARAWTIGTPSSFRAEGSPPTITCMREQVLVVDATRSAHNLALYDAPTDIWSTPAPPPRGGGFSLTNVWTGEEVVFLTVDSVPALAYAPAPGTWRALTDAPLVQTGAIRGGTAIVGYLVPGFGADGTRTAPVVFRYLP